MRSLADMSRAELEQYISALERSALCCMERADAHKSREANTNRIRNGAEACLWIANETRGVLHQHDRLPE